MMHSAAKRQKMASKGMRGMKTMEMAVKKAAEPSMREETLVTLPFSRMLLPMSMAMTVPMMLQGPPMQLPMRNMARQQVQAAPLGAKETTNMTTALISRSGLRKSARLLQRSTRKPTAVPPTRLPRSIMLAMYPFSAAMSPPFPSKNTGSQNSSPQMQPFRHEYPSTYSGTRGRHITEKIPKRMLGCDSPAASSSYAYRVAASCACRASYSCLSQLSRACCSGCGSSGFSLRRRSMRRATATAKAAVSAKLQTQESWCVSRRLQRLEAMMLPTLAFMAQRPISTPFLFFWNQFPKMPIMPGHPVAWKNPFMHIATAVSTGLKKPVAANSRGKKAQARLARRSPVMMQVLRETRWMTLPRAAMPSEQLMRQRASTMPRNSPLTPNSPSTCAFEYDHPSRSACRLAYPKNVSPNASAFFQKSDAPCIPIS